MAKKIIYDVKLLGESVPVHLDTEDTAEIFNIANMVTLINILGKPYYEDLLKQNIEIEPEIVEVVNKKFYSN